MRAAGLSPSEFELGLRSAAASLRPTDAGHWRPAPPPPPRQLDALGTLEHALRGERHAAGGHRGVGVAVSGGADSTALCLLADRWARQAGVRLRAFTVNQQLRLDSGQEAARVHERLVGRGVAHEVLGSPPPLRPAEQPAAAATMVTENEARRRRYSALAAACARHKLGVLLTAHTLDDAVETVLMRLGRGASSLDGMSGIPAARWLERDRSGVRTKALSFCCASTVFRSKTVSFRAVPLDQGPAAAAAVLLLRPLLNTEKAMLAATCQAAGCDWEEDPTNQSADHCYRNRIRLLAVPALLPKKPPPQPQQHWFPDRQQPQATVETDGQQGVQLLESWRGALGRIRAARGRVAHMVRRFERAHITQLATGCAIGSAAFCALPDVFAARVLGAAVATVTGASGPPGHRKLLAATAALVDHYHQVGRTETNGR
eukprot:SAG22_NODE_31_length_27697_cov_7.384376_7_plen_431_part_00